MADLAHIVATFGQVLHVAGIPATPERRARFAQAVVDINPIQVTDLYWIGRVTLLSSREQIETYDLVFNQVFRGIVDLKDVNEPAQTPNPENARESGEQQPANEVSEQEKRNQSGAGSNATPGEKSEENDTAEPPALLAPASNDERLQDTSFSECTPQELDLIAALVAKLPLVPPRRPSRRSKRHNSGQAIDMRSTIRHSYSTAGDPVDLMYRKRKDRPRRVVLIADVSGSMEPYSRIYLHLMLGAVRALHAEAFVFATRLTRLTRFLSTGDPDIAYRKVAQNTPDWFGGTRIGKTMLEFIRDHGQRGIARGAVIVIVSDGWETDDPEILKQAMQRLARLSHHIIWVNPRKAAANYEPLVAGMAAALPYVDTFVSGHSLRALQEVMDAIRNAQERTIVSPRQAAS